MSSTVNVRIFSDRRKKVSDEKLIKAALDAQKALRPHAEAIKALRQVDPSIIDKLWIIKELSSAGLLEEHMYKLKKTSELARMTESARLFREDFAFKQMMESLDTRQELSRTHFGPMWELQHSKIFDLVSPSQRDKERFRQVMAGYEANFCLPEVAETARLLADSATLAMEKFGLTSSRLQEAIESMRTPWLDIQDKLRSISGFADLQGIGHALHTMQSFDENLSAALRLQLGDWRDTITWRPEIFTDLAVRADFYVGLGFNPALTDFPLPAFEQSLEIAGLPRELPPVADADPEIQTYEDREEDYLERTNAAHDMLQRLERRLRRFIDDRMTEVFGQDWPKHRLPNGIYDDWREKKRKAEESGAEERPLIEYADFTHYALIICRSDNWRTVFRIFFSREESVRETFHRLHPIRLDVAHSRLITQDDELLLRVEDKRLRKAMSGLRSAKS
jgi:Swt1-like HEPN